MNRRYITGAVICLALIFALLPAVAIAGPLGDLTAPVTVSDVEAVYDSAAVIHLTAVDYPGAEVIVSGVKSITYKVDDGIAVVTNGAAATVNVTTVGAHTLSFWAEDNDGNVAEVTDAPFTVNDYTPPTTVSDREAAYMDSGTITLYAVDEFGGSGVDSTWFILDGAPAVKGTVVNFDTYGAHTLAFWSVDVEGNQETPIITGFEVFDTIAPVTVSDAKTDYYNSHASIALTASDTKGSGVAATYYALDGEDPVAGTAVVCNVVGEHTLAFWSTDAEGNVEDEKTANFTVHAGPVPGSDVLAPVSLSDADAAYLGSPATVKLTTTDEVGGAGIKSLFYKVDGGATVEVGLPEDPPFVPTLVNPITPTVLAPTVHHRNSPAVSYQNNTCACHTDGCNECHDIGPAPDITTTDAEPSSHAFIEVTPCVACHVVTAPQPPARTISKDVVVSGVGAHTIEFWGADKADNVETPHKVAAFTIEPDEPEDTTDPVTTSDAVANYVGSATITLSATDAESGVDKTYYSLDGGADTVYAAPITVNALGAHTLEFWSTDKAGNTESAKSANFTIAPVGKEDTTLSLSGPLVSGYRSASLRGRLLDEGSVALGNKPVLIEYSYDQVTWETLNTTFTDKQDSGGYYFEYLAKPKQRTYYRASFAGDADFESSDSLIATVLPKVLLERTTSWSSISVGKTYTAKGYISPYHGVDYSNKVDIKAYKKESDGKYHYVKTFAGTYKYYSDSKTIYEAKISFTKSSSKGSWKFVAYHAADAKNAATSGSADYVTLK